MDPFKLRFKNEYLGGPLVGKFINNAHTLQFNPSPDHMLRVVKFKKNGNEFRARLAQFHFHWGDDNTKGSEHTYGGQAYPLEVHLVHLNMAYDMSKDHLTHGDGALVIGIMFEPLEPDDDPCYSHAPGNKFFDSLMEKIPDLIEPLSETCEVEVDYASLFDAIPDLENNVSHYKGSLTTPDCQEAVQWINVLTPVKVSQRILDRIRTKVKDNNDKIMVNNFRPPQPINGRTVYKKNDMP